ncbi:aldehyde dehydrogenase (NADP(+)) [Noviherbaspirillum sp. CPCC 100848]|uniref:Aldehyde dehydrogenase (NADP(+)) n=1 Tax=Noviherbaspirillum album TaxID=3080276 RepID=A0ABU6JE90_9BURK|nr:aldehyde dehydrogenase (NADP(+)) [Noviherbaspirillum sp. CPCC 100848]MEC4721776.1 aldehyde dehydrogenase (NADP(+)) [Noviherbaspirillum sp. CPCC 100848]
MTPNSSDTLQESTSVQIDAAVQLAVAASDQWAASSAAARSVLLRELASSLEAERERLVGIANEESFLGTARLNGELDRTAFQLRAFADSVDAGEPFAVIDDEAVPGAPPAGHPRLLRVNVPLGPVAMFSASNFPFAFSVLGGDTASALAAGCPVVIKAHPAHPRLSTAVFELALAAAQRSGAPAGVLSMVSGASREVGVHLVRHPDIAAVAFTGSYIGGMALQKEINARPKPIPFFGELGSINPIVALPAALETQGAELATTLAASIAQGSGQFCTSPGVLIAYDNAVTDAFVEQLAAQMDGQNTHAMLSPGIRKNFDEGVARLNRHPAAKRVTTGEQSADRHPVPNLVSLDTEAFLRDHALREEIFGPSCVVVRSKSTEQLLQVLAAIGGSLTVTVWGANNDDADTQSVVRAAVRIAGRVLFSGVPTGVAVTRAQHHGGPFPSSTRPQTTSVGLMAMQRFLRPVALQEPPAWLAGRGGVPL